MQWVEFKASLCSSCSNPRHESFNPNGPAYVAEALICRACAARDRKVQSWRNDEHADPSGIYFVVRERDDM